VLSVVGFPVQPAFSKLSTPGGRAVFDVVMIRLPL
jgi:hypothetical protein